MKVRVPASSANLGPGFDTLALALSLYVTVEVLPAPELAIVQRGYGSEIECSRDHLAARVVRDVLGHDNVTIDIESSIPLARGLGSSAALAVATAASAGAYDAFIVGAALDGHGENAAASYFGGLVGAAKIGDTYEAMNLALDPRISSIVVIPEQKLSTQDARSVLPKTIALSDAVYNLQHLTLLLGGLANLDLLVPEYGRDMIHELARERVYSPAKDLKDILLGAGAAIATWSGAGTSMIGLFDRYEANEKIEFVNKAINEMDIDAVALVLEVDLEGLQLVGGDEYGEVESKHE